MIKTLLSKPITSLVFLLVLAQGLFAQYPGSPVSFQRQEVSGQKVQLALLLDASGSMKKYLEQAQGELWYTVNEILSAYEGYATPQLEISIMVYGFRQAGRRNDFIYTVVPFTTDLDWAASELYKIETGGSVELPIKAVNQATRELNWSTKPGDLKFLFIAGNEKFAINKYHLNRMEGAQMADISINTIFAGSYFKGIKQLWKAAAVYGQGEYFALEQPAQERWRHQPSYDRDYIARLNRRLYDTYLPYGSYGNGYWDRYCYLDNYAWDYGYDSYYWRIYYKTQVNYYNPQWDLVDAIACGYTTWDQLDDDDLPQDIRDLKPEDRNAYIEDLWKRRQNILNDIRSYGSSQAPVASTSGIPGGGSGGGTVGSIQYAIDKVVRKKVQNSSAVLLKPAEVHTPPIPAIGGPDPSQKIIKKKTSPQSSGNVGINPQTTVLRQENPAIPAAPVSPDKRVVNPVNKPKPPVSSPNPVKPIKSTEPKKAPVGSITQKQLEDQKIQAAQIEADRAREIELQQIEKAKQTKIAAEQAERERIRAQAENARIERERLNRVAAQQAAERERQQQQAREQAQRERQAQAAAERARLQRANQQAQEAAKRQEVKQEVQRKTEAAKPSPAKSININKSGGQPVKKN